MQPPPPAYTRATAADRTHIMAECGLQDFMAFCFINNLGRKPPQIPSYTSLITSAVAAALPAAAPPKIVQFDVQENTLRQHRYDMGVLRDSKAWKKLEVGKKKAKGPATRLLYLTLAIYLVGGLGLLICGCRQKPRSRWAVITGVVMLSVFASWLIGYHSIWRVCGDIENLRKTKTLTKYRIGWLIFWYCIAVLASGIGLLVWGVKHKPEKVQWAVLAGAVILSAYAAVVAMLFVCCGCLCKVEKVVEA